jgi:hypothetical protein
MVRPDRKKLQVSKCAQHTAAASAGSCSILQRGARGKRNRFERDLNGKAKSVAGRRGKNVTKFANPLFAQRKPARIAYNSVLRL